MKVLLLYGTNATGTLDAAEIIRDTMLESAFDVHMFSARDAKPGDLKHYDAVILGSCSWMRMDGKTFLDGQLQQDMFGFAQDLQKHEMKNTKFAIFALGDSRYSKFCAAADHLEKLVESVKGEKLGSTLRLDKYFFKVDENRQAVVWWANHIVRTLLDEAKPQHKHAVSVPATH